MCSGPVGLGAIRTRIAVSMRPMLAALLNRYPLAVFLTGTILNVVTVLIGTVIGVLLGSRMPVRIQQVLTDGLGLFVIVLGVSMGIRVLTDPAALPGDELAVLQRSCSAPPSVSCSASRTASKGSAAGSSSGSRAEGEPSRVAEAFITASIVFCVGPLTILGSIENGLTGEIQLLAVKSLLDGVASDRVCRRAGLAASRSRRSPVLVVQGGIAGGGLPAPRRDG